MSDRYWVGGSGTWNTTNTANWSTTNGGSGGASVPTSTDDVYFTGSSGTGTVTISGVVVCQSFITYVPTNSSVTFSASGATIQVYAIFDLSGASGFSGNPTVQLLGGFDGSIVSNAKSLGGVTVNKTSGTVLAHLADALTSTGPITVTAGTFTTNNYAVTASSLSSSNSNTRTINLGSSTVTLSSSTPIIFTQATGLTFNAGTSAITLSNASSNLSSVGQTFYNVTFSSTAAVTNRITAGGNTFNNLTVAGRASAGVSTFQLEADQTVNGTLTLSAGTNATMRTFVQSNTLGTARTLTCAAVASLQDIDFRDITIAGAAAPVSGTRLGDCKGNSGITFPAPKTVYFRPNVASWNWGQTPTWSDTVGGLADNIWFPLAQDTAVFPSAYPNSAGVVTINAAYNIGTIDMSARTSNTMTLATGSTTPAIYGNWINGTGTTLTGTGRMTFTGRSSQTIRSEGKTFTQTFTIESPSGTVTLQDALVASQNVSAVIRVNAGTFDAAGYNVTLSGASSTVDLSSSTLTRTAAVGSGTWSIAGLGSAWNAATSTNLTVTGTGTISLTSASAKTFAGGSIQTYPTLNQGGTGTLTITGSNKFAGLTNTAIGRIQFTGGTTNEFTSFNINGVAGNLLQLGSTNTTQAILKKPSTWYIGANSTDGGNNTGLTFTSGGGIDYLSVSYIDGQLSIVVIVAAITESATAADSSSTIATLNITVSETANAADLATASAFYYATANESATISDAVEAIKLYLGEIIEGATSAEVVDAARTLLVAITESTAGADSTASLGVLTATAQEAAQGADAAQGGLLFSALLAEAANAQDLVAAAAVIARAVQEAVQSADAVSVAASSFGAVTSDAAQGADSAQGANTGSSSLSESAAAAEQSSALFMAATQVSEQGAASEAAAAQAVFTPFVQEQGAAAEQTSVAPSVFSAVATAVAAMADSVNAPGSIYNAALPVEGAAAADSLIGAYLWNLIVNSQDPGWAAIQNPQNPGWTNIDDSHDPGWQNIDIT